MKKMLLPILLLLMGKTAFAQQDAPLKGPEVTLHFSALSFGPGQDLKKQMRKDGFGWESTAAGFFGSGKNPTRNEGAIQLGVRLPVKEKYKVKGLFNHRESEVVGNAALFEPLTVNAKVTTVAGLGYLPVKSTHFRAGAGPAFHFVNGPVWYGEQKQDAKRYAKPGFVLETGFITPANSKFFMDLQAQYFYVGKVDFGSYTFSTTGYDGEQVSLTTNFTNTRLSNFSFSIGAGYRFNRG
ncbi:hypothetical protein ACFSRY_01645 [Pontibacter locisalis]|uniref:Outer membrane protein beta-barrel domain-containing protein n=1 Tax=Pontibacter locisalis TaxID=1719035 RepID=A0ABW5IHE6_9BACT